MYRNRSRPMYVGWKEGRVMRRMAVVFVRERDLSVHLSIFLSVCFLPYTKLSFQLPINYLFSFPSLQLSVHQSVFLSISICLASFPCLPHYLPYTSTFLYIFLLPHHHLSTHSLAPFAHGQTLNEIASPLCPFKPHSCLSLSFFFQFFFLCHPCVCLSHYF